MTGSKRVALVVAAIAMVGGVAVAGRSSTGAPPRSPGEGLLSGRTVVGDVATGAARRHRYVSPHGSDDARGSRSRPWRTIAHAAAAAAPGTTVHVAPGRYRGPLHIDRSGTRTQRVRFVASRRWQATVRATSTGSIAAVQIGGDYVTFEGFQVTGSGGDGTVGIDVEGSHVTILGNHVHDVAVPCFDGTNGGAGIVVGGGARERSSRDVLVEDNRVEDIGTGARDGRCRAVNGIYASVPRVTIVNNIVQRVVADGITSWHAARELTIANNLSIANGGHGILIGSGDTDATNSGHTGTVVANNIVYGNTLSGIGESSDGSHPVGPGNRFLNNLVFANQDTRSGIGGLSRGEIVAGTVEADPQLGRGLRPGANSPAIDAGTCVTRPRRDIAGVIRPQGRGVDIGPYERRSARGSCAR